MEQMIVPILLALCVIFAVLAVLYLVLDGKQSRQTVRKAAKPDSTRTSVPERPVKKSRKEQPKKPLPTSPKPEPERMPAAAPKPEPEEILTTAPKPEPEEIPAAVPKPEPEEMPTSVPEPEPEKAATVLPKRKPKGLSAASSEPRRKKPAARSKPEPETIPTGVPEQVLPEKPAETQESSPEQTEEKRIFQILTHDPAFAADDFKAYAVSCFRRLQAVHRLEDMPAIRGFVGETFYLRKRSDLAMSFLSDDAPAPPEETVQSCVIIGDMIRNGMEYLLVLLKTVGDTENVKRYRMVFMRQEGTRTLSAMPLSAFRCPVCGKALSVDIVGICNECGVCVADGSQYWLLERMESE